MWTRCRTPSLLREPTLRWGEKRVSQGLGSEALDHGADLTGTRLALQLRPGLVWRLPPEAVGSLPPLPRTTTFFLKDNGGVCVHEKWKYLISTLRENNSSTLYWHKGVGGEDTGCHSGLPHHGNRVVSGRCGAASSGSSRFFWLLPSALLSWAHCPRQ